MTDRAQSSRLEAFAPGRVVVDEHELTVELRYLCSPWSRYTGPRQVIEQTGLVPDSVTWVDGYGKYTWEGADGLLFRLTRIRPSGAKGPRRAFISCDHWELSVRSPYRNDDAETLRVKERELSDLRYRQSPAGQEARQLQQRRFLTAHLDRSFQAVLAQIMPVLAKGGRNE